MEKVSFLLQLNIQKKYGEGILPSPFKVYLLRFIIKQNETTIVVEKVSFLLNKTYLLQFIHEE